jgi:hypothetical protein
MLTGTSLTFLSPSADGQLMLYDTAARTTTPIAQDVASWQPLAGWLFWQTRSGELFALPPGGAPIAVSTDASLFASLGDNRFLFLRGEDLWHFSLDAGASFVAANAAQVIIGSDYLAVLRSDRRLTVFDLADWLVRYERGGVDFIGAVFALGLPYLPYLVDRYGDDPRLELWFATGEAHLLARGGSIGPFVRWIEEPERGLVFTNNGIYFAPLP